MPNRAERRGNPTARRFVSGGSKLPRRFVKADAQAGWVDPLDRAVKTLNEADAADARKAASERPRAATGRFQAKQAQPPAPPPPVVDMPLSRQQRRHQERMAAKVAKVWRDVTGGDGLVLVDGKPVSASGE